MNTSDGHVTAAVASRINGGAAAVTLAQDVCQDASASRTLSLGQWYSVRLHSLRESVRRGELTTCEKSFE